MPFIEKLSLYSIYTIAVSVFLIAVYLFNAHLKGIQVKNFSPLTICALFIAVHVVSPWVGRRVKRTKLAPHFLYIPAMIGLTISLYTLALDIKPGDLPLKMLEDILFFPLGTSDFLTLWVQKLSFSLMPLLGAWMGTVCGYLAAFKKRIMAIPVYLIFSALIFLANYKIYLFLLALTRNQPLMFSSALMLIPFVAEGVIFQIMVSAYSKKR